MSMDIAVFRGRAADLEDEERFAPLDVEAARALIGSAEGAELAGEHAAITRDTLDVDVLLVLGEDGLLRAVEAGITFADASPVEQRRELHEVLDLFVDLAERLDARLYYDGRFLGRSAAHELATRVGGGTEPSTADAGGVDSFAALSAAARRGSTTYRLHVLRGDPGLGEDARFWPLDAQVVAAFLDSRPEVQRLGGSLVWSTDGVVAEISPAEDEDGVPRSVAFGLYDSQPDEEVDEADLRELLDAVLTLADGLSARVWDEQWERFVGREDVDELVRVLA